MFSSPDMWDEMMTNPKLLLKFWDSIPEVDELPQGEEGDICKCNERLWIFANGLWVEVVPPIPK